MTDFETIELTNDITGGGILSDLAERYQRWNEYGRCVNTRYANSRTGHRDQNPAWPCSDLLNGKRS